MEFGKTINHKIIINPTNNNGFIVTVGCGVFVYETPDGLLTDLEQYLTYPTKLEKLYNESTGAQEVERTEDNTERALRPGDASYDPAGAGNSNPVGVTSPRRR